MAKDRLQLVRGPAPQVRYCLYHTRMPGFEQPKEARRFMFYPQAAFRPMGFIIFKPGDALVTSLVVGLEEQLTGSIHALHFDSRGLTIEQLEQLTKGSMMQSILASYGIPHLTLPTVNIGTQFSIELTEPVDIVAIWGIEAIVHHG